ncbi:Zinc finger protein klf1 [Beauveria bassiana]|nr:Zinc finger protein klf1 [Beauveria bassiana]KAH8718948.1 Zinc finger protein klf1 [Beauveria bassiana]
MSDSAGSVSPHNGLASSAPAKKRKRKSRKGLEKRFICEIDACGKVYSRAEHLQRHQLNHNSPQTFCCEYPNCSRTFVRPDLLKRHLDRHVAKETQMAETNTAAPCSLSPLTPAAAVHPHEYSHHGQTGGAYGVSVGTARQFDSSAADSYMAAASPIARVDTQQVPLRSLPNLNAHQASLDYNLPSTNYTQAPGMQDMPHETSPVTDQMLIYDHLPMGDAGPVFGADTGLRKSPTGGMPEDFVVYLFDSAPSNTGNGNSVLPQAAARYGELNQAQYPDSNAYLANRSGPIQQIGPQQIMSVYNLLEPNMPEASMSDARSQEVFDYIKDRFHGGESEDLRHTRDYIVSGDRSRSDHILSKRMMQAYIGSFWKHFNAQMPILHKPTFVADKTPMILLLAIMATGAASLDKKRGTEVTMAGVRLSNFIVTHLRWEVFMDAGFRPPAKLWIFQTLIFLELYEKMCSTRELHERAHIHHATTITLMRRGRSLIGKAFSESPTHAGGPRPPKTADEQWDQWIVNESTKRAACAAFMVDSLHATMFGHSAVMAAHEMRLPLPCDDSLWKATSSAEFSRTESKLLEQGVTPMSFLEGLKRTLNKQQVHTTYFVRAVLMAGLLNVTYHLSQRDMQANVLGGGMGHAAGGRDKWRIALTRAYDFWKSDFDDSLSGKQPQRDPYGNDEIDTEVYTMFEARTVLHHLAHMAMHADIVDCQIFAGAKRLLGRPVSANEYAAAQRRITEEWAPSAKARDAAYYALKLLRFVLAPDQILQREDVPVRPQSGQPYEFRHDILLNRPWVLYFAALIIWCYGYAIEGPSLRYAEPATHHDRWMQMRGYLSLHVRLSDPNELQEARGFNGNISMLMVLRDSLRQSRWELLHEAGELLQNCIALSQGRVIA